MRLYNEIEKEKQIKKEIRKLLRLFKHLPADKKKAAEGLIQEAAFMKVTLEETRYIIDHEGVIENFEQGAQRFKREHPATKVYNTMINRYSNVCKQLFDMIPDPETSKTAEDELMAFVKKARK
jgi:ADP-heptose:LPS heptosyltransferase